jgi:plastocyanin domain-containing protein
MKATTITIIIAGLMIGGFIILLSIKNTQKNTPSENIQNVTIVDGKQIIEIKAKDGYTPRVSTAKAGIPTIIRFTTNGTFDCSASVRIPSLGIYEVLPNSGSKDIDLGTPQVGTLQGTCGMGMYPFEIKFN